MIVCFVKKIVLSLFRKVYRKNNLLIFSILNFHGMKSPRVVLLNDLCHAIDDKVLKKRVIKEIDSGSCVYGVFVGGELAHFSCRSLKRQYVFEIKCDLIIKDSDFYIYNCFTQPKFRGMGIYGEVLNHILYLNQQRRGVIACLDYNLSSLKVINKVGFKKNGCVQFFKFFLWEKLSNQSDFALGSR